MRLEITTDELKQIISDAIKEARRRGDEAYSRTINSEKGSVDQKFFAEKWKMEDLYASRLYQMKAVIDMVDEVEIIDVERDDDDGLDTVLNWRT